MSDGAVFYTSADLLDALTALDDRPWKTFGRAEKGLTGKAMAGLLKPFGMTGRLASVFWRSHRRGPLHFSWLRAVPRGRSTPLRMFTSIAATSKGITRDDRDRYGVAALQSIGENESPFGVPRGTISERAPRSSPVPPLCTFHNVISSPESS